MAMCETLESHQRYPLRWYVYLNRVEGPFAEHDLRLVLTERASEKWFAWSVAQDDTSTVSRDRGVDMTHKWAFYGHI
jgi:hypothetical protein